MACGYPCLVGEFCGLRSQVAGYASVEPIVDLSGQVKDFECHGAVLLKSGLTVIGR
jgi:hypothetical protein